MAEERPRYSTIRRHKRVPVRLDAQVAANGEVVSGICVDLSAGGAGLDLMALPQVGQTVEVTIRLPTDEVLTMRGEVMHAGEAGAQRCGLRFGRLEPRSLMALHSLVAAV